MQDPILTAGEKIHIVHRRHFDKEPHRHFVGVVEAYQNGVARVSGHVYTVDIVKFKFFRRPEARIRLVSIVSGDVLVNILPATVDLDKVVYKQEAGAVRVTDGSEWHLDISEHVWL